MRAAAGESLYEIPLLPMACHSDFEILVAAADICPSATVLCCKTDWPFLHMMLRTYRRFVLNESGPVIA